MPTNYKGRLLKGLDPNVMNYHDEPTLSDQHPSSIPNMGGASEKPIYYTKQSSAGQLGIDFGYGYFFDAHNICHGQSRVPFSTTNDHYGELGRLYRLPKTIIVIWNAGWWYMENYPMYLGPDYLSYSESIYFTPPNAGSGGLEKTIDYYMDFGNAVNAFGLANNIRVEHVYRMYDSSTYTGPTQLPITIHSISGVDTNYAPTSLISRWMFPLIPRWRVPNGDDLFGYAHTTPLGNPAYIPLADEQYIIGGKVLFIVFCTDGYSAYHGCSSTLFNSSLPDLSTVGSTAMMMEDIETIKRRSQYFEKWGTILVASPKNPEFFPLWLQDSSTSTNTFTPQAYAYYDAQLHFNSVNALLSGYNFTLLMRPTHMVTPPTPRHLIYESQSMGFTRGQITVSEIMTAVESFWAGE